MHRYKEDGQLDFARHAYTHTYVRTYVRADVQVTNILYIHMYVHVFLIYSNLAYCLAAMAHVRSKAGPSPIPGSVWLVGAGQHCAYRRAFRDTWGSWIDIFGFTRTHPQDACGRHTVIWLSLSEGLKYHNTWQIWSWNDGRHQNFAGWWFGTFFVFPCIGNSNPNWLIVFRGVETAKHPTLAIHVI